jgi:haloalkane dehalogenase
MSHPTEGPDIPPVVRTADHRFENLGEFDFPPHYVEVERPSQGPPLRMHFVDAGPRDAPIVLMVHGEPTWSYLYRKLIPVFVAAGLRAIAVDLIGFGRSDKPTRPADYSFSRHVAWLREAVLALDLREITLVCQDWGGPIGMGVLAREPSRFDRVCAANTMLHTAEHDLSGRLAWSAHALGGEDVQVSTALLDWRGTSSRTPVFEASPSIPFATVRGVTEEVQAAYDAPFPSEWHKAGLRQFPLLIPVTPSDEGAAINRQTWDVLRQFERPFLTLFSDSDPPTRGWAEIFQERVPGARDQPHQILERAGHFWQEDCGAEAAERIVDWIGATPVVHASQT